jgi:chromosomal replication initiation ATPase DnaA
MSNTLPEILQRVPDRDLIREYQRRFPTDHDPILIRVAAAYSVTPEQMRGNQKTRNISRARVAFVAHIPTQKPGITSQEIAHILAKDSTTIWHLKRRHHYLLQDPQYLAAWQTLTPNS